MVLKLYKHELPTPWNKDMAIGALAGTMIFPVVGTVIGGAIGGQMGKGRMEREYADGKVVSKPTMWNKDALLGGLIGLAVSGVVALGAALTGGLVGGELFALGGILAGAVGAPIVGTVVGGQMGKSAMDVEYRQAVAQTQGMQQSQTQARGQTYSFGPNGPQQGMSASHYQDMVASQEAARGPRQQG